MATGGLYARCAQVLFSTEHLTCPTSLNMRSENVPGGLAEFVVNLAGSINPFIIEQRLEF